MPAATWPTLWPTRIYPAKRLALGEHPGTRTLARRPLLGPAMFPQPGHNRTYVLVRQAVTRSNPASTARAEIRRRGDRGAGQGSGRQTGGFSDHQRFDDFRGDWLKPLQP